MDSPHESCPPLRLSRIISGGQTGAERAGLDWAIKQRIDHGGFCPRSRGAEGGPVPASYELIETVSYSPLVAAERNVMASDGILILTCRPAANTSSRRVMEFASRHGKPCLHVWRAAPMAWTLLAVQAFFRDHGITVLNVAGSRESKEPAVTMFVRAVLDSTTLGLAVASGDDFDAANDDQLACLSATRTEAVKFHENIPSYDVS